jgi:NAD+ diphosphatase
VPDPTIDYATLAFAQSPELVRPADGRVDEAWLAARRADPRSEILLFAGERPLLFRGGETLTRREPTRLEGAPALLGEPVFLGVDARDVALFAGLLADPEHVPEDVKLVELRSIAMQGLVSGPELGLLARARSLLHWHARHRFCANCGATTVAADGGHRRRCDGCETDHFPRTDPVVIMVVRHGDRFLLGRQPRFVPGVYSALAGFVEPGETIEDAGRREVAEEAGVRVGAVRYIGSQPWPFPASLMIGLLGEAESDALQIDRTELEDARWFTREDLGRMLEWNHPDGLKVPPPLAIAHHLIRAALAST